MRPVARMLWFVDLARTDAPGGGRMFERVELASNSETIQKERSVKPFFRRGVLTETGRGFMAADEKYRRGWNAVGG
ncbi:MAG: hypothetical protein SNJ62_04000 [Chloracidobacterium sp.]|uniref:Uncharacterized protein n=1 Tax=Chloracidobacterium validum TaxID=2821543 RepID=A0ABX8BDU4_9BACT|nr:hypothetical protein [Chloracidobacterium validum]QUW04191.1 hypothetical protein J8C06_14205 [Chloracidobacterium validum]